jgi:hypothetical protein
MADQTQTFASHRRWIPMWHFFALPVLTINVFVVAVHYVRDPRLINGWAVIVAIALAIGIFVSRSMPLRAQDRIIRLEERARLERVLPSDLRGRVGELSATQLIAIRFAADDEVPELTRRTLNGELKSQGDIKRAIRNWRADTLRV